MANQPNIIPVAWAANNSTTETIPETTTEVGKASWDQGFPVETSLPLSQGGIPPKYGDFNGVLNALSQFAVYAQSGGQYAWSATLEYSIGSLVLGSDGKLYMATVASGPSSTAVNPVGDQSGTWSKIADAQEIASMGINVAPWSSSETYAAGEIVAGSDGLLYVARVSSTAVQPVGDASGTWGMVSADIATFYFNPQSSTLSTGSDTIAGECNVIKTGGKVIMIDVGGTNRTASIKAYLAGIGVTKVDYLIITHYHGDHCFNITQTSGGSPVNTLELDWSACHCYFPMLPSENSTEYSAASTRRTACINFANAFCAGYEFPDEGDALTIGDFKLEFINCGDTARGEIEAIQDEAQTAGVYATANYHLNDYSMCEYVHAGDVSVFYAADLEYAGEKRLVDNGLIHPCDLLKFPHHGSNSTTALPYYIPFANFARTPRVVVQNGVTSAAKAPRLESMNWTQSVIFAPDLKPAIFRCNNKALEMVQCDNVRSISQFPQLYSGVNKISSNEDINDYVDVGTYTIMGASEANTMLNTPITDGVASSLYNGKLVVMAGSLNEYIIQIWYDQGLANIYIRKGSLSDGEWTFQTWKKIFLTGSSNNTMYSTITVPALKGSDSAGALRLWGSGNVRDETAQLLLLGGNYTGSEGRFILRARDANGNHSELVGTPTGSLTWDGNEIQTTSDERRKMAFSEVPDAVLDAWGKVNWEQFKFRDAAAIKGEENCRWHNGLVAQRVKAVFEEEGLDACAYGILCYDVWEDEYEDVEVIDAPATIDDDGNEITPEQKHIDHVLVQEAGDAWTIRYAEAQAMEAAYQRRRAARAEARLDALEQRLDEMEAVFATLGTQGVEA